MVKTGTREWAKYNRNFITGCKHDCKYCYARAMAIRFKRKTQDDWKEMEINMNKYKEKPHKLDGRIMFPTTHDITPEFIDETIFYLAPWLQAGNEILITSKPHFECIKKICDELINYKDQIIFRFTIGSLNDDVLKFWEPDAPTFEERFKALKYAYEKGFETSVSSEPFLDENIIQLVKKLLPYITNTIWIGKMNRIETRVNTDKWSNDDFIFLERVKKAQTDDAVWEIYKRFRDEPKIHWKDSIKRVIGLPEEEIG
jgi:DNA repair photolyase